MLDNPKRFIISASMFARGTTLNQPSISTKLMHLCMLRMYSEIGGDTCVIFSNDVQFEVSKIHILGVSPVSTFSRVQERTSREMRLLRSLTKSGKVQIGLLLRSRTLNKGRLPKPLGKSLSDRLQPLRLNLTNELGRIVFDNSERLLNADLQNHMCECHGLISVVVDVDTLRSISLACNTLSDFISLSPDGNSSRFEQPEIVNFSRACNTLSGFKRRKHDNISWKLLQIFTVFQIQENKAPKIFN